MTSKVPSVFFYVQHLLGIGHLARASRIARAFIDRGMNVTLVTGGMPVQGFPGPGINHIALPPIAVSDSGFSGLVTATRQPADAAYLDARKDRLLAAFHACKPDMVMIEAFPFGRRQVRFELLPLIDAIEASRPRPYLVSSVRDILQRNIKPGRNEETVALVRSAFDLVLVHGDPDFAPLDDSFPLTHQIADRIRYTGLVCPPPPPPPTETFDVLVSVGGGAAGKSLVTAAVNAARMLPQLAKWCIITGPNLLQQDYDALARTLPSNACLTRFRPDLANLMAGARLSVSQTGYNTVADILVAGCHALLVPYGTHGETEQTDRAHRLHQIGRARMIEEADLTADRLAKEILQEITRKLPPEALKIRINGARRSAEIVLDLVNNGARS